MIDNNFILLCGLILLLVINLVITKDYMNPKILLKLSWILSAIILNLYTTKWDYIISNEALVIFLGGIMLFDLGFNISANFIKKFKLDRLKKDNLRMKNGLRNSIVIVFSLVILNLILINSLVPLASIFVNLSTLRNLFLYQDEFIVNIIQFIFRIIEILTFLIFSRMLFDGSFSSKKKFSSSMLIVTLVLVQFLSTGRYRLLAIMIELLFVYLIYYKKTHRNLSVRKIMSTSSIAITSFFLIFVFYGKYLVNKISNNPFDSIAIYTSGSLVGFDMIKDKIANSSEYWGQYLLSPMYNLLSRIGLVPYYESSRSVQESVYWNGNYGTNVYTFFEVQIRDFGYIGIVFSMIFLGLFFGVLYILKNREKRIGIFSVIYIYFMFSLITGFFQDSFFLNSTMNFISIGVIIIYFTIPKILIRKL